MADGRNIQRMLLLRNRDLVNNRRPPVISGKSAGNIKGSGGALKAFCIDLGKDAVIERFQLNWISSASEGQSLMLSFQCSTVSGTIRRKYEALRQKLCVSIHIRSKKDGRQAGHIEIIKQSRTRAISCFSCFFVNDNSISLRTIKNKSRFAFSASFDFLLRAFQDFRGFFSCLLFSNHI